MASYQDSLKFVPSPPKLPSITQGNYNARNSSSRTNLTIYQWMAPLRRKIDHSIDYRGYPYEEDVEELTKELIKTMIFTLQSPFEKQLWLELNTILTLVLPYDFFLKSTSFSHYVERLCGFCHSNSEKLYDVPILETLKRLFPDCVARCKEGTLTRWQMKKESPSHPESARNVKAAETETVFFGGKNPFSVPKRLEDPEQYFRPKKLTLSAIEESIGSVAFEKASAESVRKTGVSAVGVAANVRLPGMFVETVEEEASFSIGSETSKKSSRGVESVRALKEEFRSITGREAVELFLNHKHLHKVKFIYLNVAPNRHYRPYDLISVPRDHIEKEHYIFSSFGVLHALPDGDQSETLTLADWNRAAVIWNALSQIAFFRNYLIRKMFSRWKANVKLLKFLQTRQVISNSLLPAVPEFGSALLHIFRLIDELSEVQFFPNKPNRTYYYAIGEFSTDFQRIKAEAGEVLELFFRYSKKVVDVTKENCYEHLNYYEELARQVKPLYLKESMYLRKMKAKQRKEKLMKAKKVTGQLVQFISLVDQVIAVHLVELARHAVTRFVNTVLCAYSDHSKDEEDEEATTPEAGSARRLDKEEEGVESEFQEADDHYEVFQPLFAAKFVFSKQTCSLEMQPPVAKFREIITSSFQQVFDLISAHAFSMHAQGDLKMRSSSRRPNSAPASVSSSTRSGESTSSTFEDGRSVIEMKEVERPNSEKNASDPTARHSAGEDQRQSRKKMKRTALTKPEFFTDDFPTSSRDDGGMVTPNMVLSTGRTEILGLFVDGTQINFHYNLLDKKKLIEKLLEDEEISESLERKGLYIEDAIREVSGFCDELNKYLPEIRRFCNDWSDEEAEAYRGKSSQEIEQLINKIKDWIVLVQSMPKFFISSNKVLYVDGRNLHNGLLPVLNSIFNKLVSTIVSEAKLISREIADEVQDTLQVLKNKDTSMLSFATYASKVNESVKKKDDMTKKVSYSRSIYDVVKMTCRQLTTEEEKLHEKTKSSWETFMFQLKDASNFVANQRPIIKKKLDEMFRELHNEIIDVSVRGSSSPVTDPNADPTEVVQFLESCIAEFQSLRAKISEVNFFHEAICREFYNVDDLKELSDNLRHKLELWQCINSSKYTIHEWRATPFRKFNPFNAMSKLDEWKAMVTSLTPVLGNDDPVLLSWQNIIEDISKQMPFMVKLSRDAIRTRHWKEVFAGMGEAYEPGFSLLVDDLLGFRLSDHAALIKRVYQDASSEYTVEKLLASIKKEWDSRQFDLAKHIYPVKTIDRDQALIPPQSKSGRRTDRQPTAFSSTVQPALQEKDSGTYVLVGVEKLTKDLTESHVTLQAMFQSRHAIEVRNDSGIWSDTLSQIGEIINLWLSCQEKWMYLNRIFNGDPSLAIRFPLQQEQFIEVDKKYREFVQSILQDSKVLSVLSRRHGQKGWRELQGEVLRKHLLNCIRMEDQVLHEVESLLIDFRSQFPRLYFMSDEDVVRLLGISGHPRGFVSYVRKCFKGAHSLVFSLPRTTRSEDELDSNVKFDIELHSSRLEATHVIGRNQEFLEVDPLPSSNDATAWLTSLEKRIKHSLVKELQDCINDRIKLGSLYITEAIHELCETELYDSKTSFQHYGHWLLKYTQQTILLADSVLWYRDVKRGLKSGKKKESFEDLKKQTLHNLKQYGIALNENAPDVNKSPARLRFQSVLSALTVQQAHHREMLRKLSDYNVTSHSFEWQKLIKHTADIVDYDYAGLRVDEHTATAGELLDRSASVGRCHVEQFDDREEYGYEYMATMSANNKGLCIGTVYTPITERCLVDLWLSLKQGQCAGLFGSNGVGKSVMLAELARVLGKLYINLCCSETTDINMLKKSLCGAVETGAWLCLDHAQRLPTSTLALLSQHIGHIQQVYQALNVASNTQYTVRGDDQCNKLKRSNSVTSLHGALSDGCALSWQPRVAQNYLDSIKRTHFEEQDADDYLQEQRNESRPVGSVVFENNLLRCRRGFAFFLSFTNNSGSYPDIPDSLRLIYRPTSVTKPDKLKLFEVWLLSSGFTDAANLATKLNSMYEIINKCSDHITANTLSSSINSTTTKIASIELRTVKSIIMVASLINQKMGVQRSRAESAVSSAASDVSSTISTSSRASRRSEIALQCHQEELALLDAILNILSLKLPNADAISKLKKCLRNIFPLSGRSILPGDACTKVAVAVQQQMLTDSLRHTPELINKVCQLHALLQFNQTVVIAGAAGSGKTTMYRLLSKALNNLCNETTMNQIIQDEEDIRPVYEPEQLQRSDRLSTDLGSERNPMASVTALSDVFCSSSNNRLNVEDVYTRVDVSVVYPNAYNTSQLFGSYLPQNKMKKQGILEKLLKESMESYEAEVKQEVMENKSSARLPSSRDERVGDQTPKNILSVKKWIVLDGEISSSWMDNLSCLMDDHRSTSTGKMEELHLHSNALFILESSDFSSASPAIASRCAIVHCNLPDLWHSIAMAWMDAAYSQYAIRQATVETWKDLVVEVVPKALYFLSQHKSSVVRTGSTHSEQESTFVCPGVHEITSFLSIFSSCLSFLGLSRNEKSAGDRVEAIQLAEKRRALIGRLSSANTMTSTTGTGSVRSRMENVPTNNFIKGTNALGFALVWAFGGSLLEDDMKEFDVFIREVFYNLKDDVVKYPEYESVFDYFVDEESGQFTLWEDKIDLRPRPSLGHDAPAYTPVHQFERYAYLSHCLLANNRSIMLIGEQGCGKSTLVRNMVQTELDLTKISILPGLKASQFQRIIESKASPAMRQHNLGLMAHPTAVIASRPVEASPSLFFFDDLSCAGVGDSPQSRSSQPLLELLRQILSIRGVYESERLLFKSLESEIAAVATCPLPGQPGAGLGHSHHTLPPRLARLFTVIHFVKPSRESILSIYHHSVQSWLEEFPTYALTRHYDLSQAIIAGVYDLYTAVLSRFKPSPRQPHYAFSLHDIGKVIQGMFLLKPAARGRPIPIRHRGVKEMLRRPRKVVGQTGRSKPSLSNEDTDSEVLPMMKTIVRLWLHENCRVFFDKLSVDEDKNWFSDAIVDVLKRHFCSGAKERVPTPIAPDSKSRIIKTPIPSAGSTPMPSSTTESGTVQDVTQDSETIDNLQSDLEFETTTTQGTDFIIDDEDSSGNTTPIADQPKGFLADGTSSTSRDKSSASSVRQSRVVVTTTSISSSGSKGQITSATSFASTENYSGSRADVTSACTSGTQLDREVTDDSRAVTTLSGDDDAQSAVTGYTTEVESAFETEASLVDTTETSDVDTTITTSSSSGGNRSYKEPTPLPSITVIGPSAGRDDSDMGVSGGKRERPSFGRSKVVRPGGAKFGVTFVPGLVEQEELPGQSNVALVPLDQVLSPNENPLSIIFCQAIFLSPSMSDRIGSTYSEMSVEELTNGLYACLDVYNSNCTQKDGMELVFFKQAVCHVARLSRALATRRGHAFLMSSSPFKGRRSLTRLVAFYNNAKIYSTVDCSMTSSTDLARSTSLRRVIKDASYEAGIKEGKVVLLIEENVARDPSCLDDVCSLIRDGQCPSLYNHSELAEIAASIVPPNSQLLVATSDSSLKLKKSNANIGMTESRAGAQERLELCLELYFARILANLHVVVLTSIPILQGPQDLTAVSERNCNDVYFHKHEELKNFHHFLRRSPDLMTRFSCVDLYGEWHQSSWRMLVQHYVEDSFQYGIDDIPWPRNSNRLDQVQCISHLMAYIHKDATARTKGYVTASLQNGADRLLSPVAIRQMVQVFVGVAMNIKCEENIILDRLNKALGKVKESDVAISKYQSERDQLKPLLQEAKKSELSWKTVIEEHRQEYHDARERCVHEEEIIKALDMKAEGLRKKTQTSVRDLHPLYKSAASAQNSLSPKYLEEIKRYLTPPPAAVEVVTCLCEMFNVSSPGWESGKSLLARENFYEELLFYDKDHISEDIFLKLHLKVKNPRFKPSHIEKGSAPAAKLCHWIHSIYRYAKKLRAMRPDIRALTKSESELLDAQAILGSKRVRCIEIKENLDEQIAKFKNASVAAKQYERSLKHLNAQVEKASSMRETIRIHSDQWTEQLRDAQSRLDSAVGDAVIVAACVAYFGHLAPGQKNQALKHWLDVAKHGCVDRTTGLFGIDRKPSSPQIERASAKKSATSSAKSDFSSIFSSFSGTDFPSSTTESELSERNDNCFVQIRNNLSPIDLLLTPDDQRDWHKNNISHDPDARLNGARLFAMTVYQASWMFLFDPDNEASLWISASFHKMRETLSLMEKEKTTNVDDDYSTRTNSVFQSEPIEEEVDDVDTDVDVSDAIDDVKAGSDTEAEEQVTITVSLSEGSPTMTEKVMAKREKTLKKKKKKSSAKSKEEETKRVDISEEPTVLNEEEEKEERQPLCPVTQLWIFPGNDPNLSAILDSAMEYGAFLLITNIELASPANIALLQKTHSRQMLSSHQEKVHHCFRIFLSTAVSINWAFRNSSFILPFPLHNFAITDLSLTERCLRERLGSIVLAQERSEFETQRRLMETDRFHLEEQVDLLHLDLVETVGAIQGGLLQSASIVQIIQTCKQGLVVTEASLKELKAMEASLLRKKADFDRVRDHGMMLYGVLQSTFIIDPLLHHLSASKFVEMFRDCIKSCKKTKSKLVSGSHSGTMIKSRVAEVNRSLTEMVLTYVNRKYFDADVTAFSTLLSLNILVMEKKMSRTSMEEFLASSDDDDANDLYEMGSANELETLERPSWMSDSMWRRVARLESRHPDCFSGLTQSISLKPNRWKEYFSSPPMLLSKVPNNNLCELTVGEKALLWKIVKPKKFTQIASDLISSVLGSCNECSYVFHLDTLIEQTRPSVPCVLLQPSTFNGSCYLPSHHLMCEAKFRGIQFVEKSALCSEELVDALDECVRGGKWLILDHCHLVADWPERFLEKLTSITTIRSEEEEEEESLIDSGSKQEIAKSEDATPPSDPIHLHPDFRLWIIVKKSKSNITHLPMVLMERAEFIALQIPASHKDLVKTTHYTITEAARMYRPPPFVFPSHLGPSYLNRIPTSYNVQLAFLKTHHAHRDKKGLIIQLSLLFSTILERSGFGKSAFSSSCSWSDGEVLDALRSSLLINNPNFFPDLFSHFLERHVSDSRDVTIVRELIKSSLAPVEENGKSKNIFADVISMHMLQETIDHIFNSLLDKPDIGKLGLVPSCAIEWSESSAYPLSEALNDMLVYRSTQCRGLTENDHHLFAARENALKRRLDELTSMMESVEQVKLNTGILSCVMMDFYWGEVERLNTVIDIVKNDLELALAAVQSNSEVSREVHAILESCARDILPQRWLDDCRHLFRFHVSLGLYQFVEFLKLRTELLVKYMDHAVCVEHEPIDDDTTRSKESIFFARPSVDALMTPACQNVMPFNLAVFTRPDLFLQHSLMAVARGRQQDPHRYTVESKFVADLSNGEAVPTNGAFDTIYIEQLRLHQAVYDLRGENLHHAISPNSQNLPWLQIKFVKKMSGWRQIDPGRTSTYQCPIWVNERKKPPICSEEDVLLFVPIETEFPPEEWFMKGVSITCHLGCD